MADIINWMRSTTLITGQYATNQDNAEWLCGNYVIKTCSDNLIRSGKEKLILDFGPYRSFRSAFAEMAEYYVEDSEEYGAHFSCQNCGISQSFDQSSPSGMESNDWTSIVTLIGFHIGHQWTFHAESENEEMKQYLSMMGLVV